MCFLWFGSVYKFELPKNDDTKAYFMFLFQAIKLVALEGLVEKKKKG